MLTILLGSVGCGPPRIGSGPSEGEGETGSDPTSSSSESTSEESTSEESAGTESGTMSTTHGFLPKLDMEGSECGLFMQDCPEGEKCVPYSSMGGNWNANKCVPVLGEQEPGEPCWHGGAGEGTDNCDETGVCWNVMEVDGELHGTCHAFCSGTADDPQCPPNSTCLISLTLCIPDCDPILQDCGPGLACYWAVSNFLCIFTTQNIPAGQPCGYINDCAGGLSCINADALPECAGAACCSPFCDLELGDAQCESVPGTSCVPFFPDMPPAGYEHVGVCMLP